ncbi:MAG: efflux RND transporter permease subunit [Desulfovibrionaceae bacterium]
MHRLLTFFIVRPVLSVVISLFILLAGFLALQELPIELYPTITPPTVSVSAKYPGASPELISSLVAAPLEEQINGVDGMMYINSVISRDGATIRAYFTPETNPHWAAIHVNNRIQTALSSLPQEVQRRGITVRKSSDSTLMFILLSSSLPQYDTIFLSNYASTNVVGELQRIHGIGDVTIHGAKPYAMRIWTNPHILASLKLSTQDIIDSIFVQNKQYPIGTIGESPNAVDVLYSVQDSGTLRSVEDFENIIVRSQKDASSLLLKDIATIELGTEIYHSTARYNGQPSISLAISLAPEGNALRVANDIEKTLKELQAHFPEGIQYIKAYDTTLYIKLSIESVIYTLIEALFLVILIIYLFLQNIKVTIIPCFAIPISIIGTFAGLYLFNSSINTFTLFALVLAIGIVVDDTILVIENVERILETTMLTPIQATIQAMEEITWPVIASTLVLCSVFIPIAFIQGLTGGMFREFAITISIAVCISSIVALTLTPALCALWLKKREAHTKISFFNKILHSFTKVYSSLLQILTRRYLLSGIFYIILFLLSYIMFTSLPKSFVPAEDQGTLRVIITLPDGASLERTLAVEEEFRKLASTEESIVTIMASVGRNALTGSLQENYASLFITLRHWDSRKNHDQSAQAILNRLRKECLSIADASFIFLLPSPIPRLGSAGGFKFYIQNQTNASVEELQKVTDSFKVLLQEQKVLTRINSLLTSTTPQIILSINKEKALLLGVDIQDIYKTLQSTLASTYINDFTLSDRPYRVLLQAQSSFRDSLEALHSLFVISRTTKSPIPLSSLVNFTHDTGPIVLERFNMYSAAPILGGAAEGYTSSQAIAIVENLAKKHLPEGYSVAWTGPAYQEKLSEGKTVSTILFSVLFIFLILAALYESFSLPIIIILTLPIALFGSTAFSHLRALSNDLYFQIALITLIGLTAKTAILIVEYAIKLHREGNSLEQAAIQASVQRIRPILMTMLSFILGSLPLVLATGAGSASKISLGTAIVGGITFYTFFGILFIPPLFIIILSVTQYIQKKLNNTAS